MRGRRIFTSGGAAGSEGIEVMGSGATEHALMWKFRVFRWVALASSGLLLAGGCSFDGWWPWAVGIGAGAALLGVFGQGT